MSVSLTFLGPADILAPPTHMHRPSNQLVPLHPPPFPGLPVCPPSTLEHRYPSPNHPPDLTTPTLASAITMALASPTLALLVPCYQAMSPTLPLPYQQPAPDHHIMCIINSSRECQHQGFWTSHDHLIVIYCVF